MLYVFLFQCLSCGKYYTHRQSLLRHQLLYCPPLRDKCNSSGTSKRVIESRSEEENVLIKIENDSEDEKSELKVTSRSKESDITPFTKISAKCEDTLRGRIIDSNYKANYKATNNFKQNTTVCTKTDSTSCSKSGGKRKRVSSKEIDIVVDEEETGCRVCDKEFYDVDSLVNHREYHLTHRTCCLCQKVMGNKSKLLTHHRSHTKELPYTCHVCEKRFAENSTLRKHEATHGERNFRCNVCSKAFVRKDYLAKHMLTHQQTYKCSQCGFVCHNRSDIEIHISEIHRG
jgi:DNA-directed RNA polymerase subunit RPC12/RpoP